MSAVRRDGGNGRVFLHVGVPKTGTTFLQAVLWRQREVALRQGLLLPLSRVGDHYRACLDVTERADRAQRPERVPGSWRRLLDAVADHRGDVVVSHEMFAVATEEQATRAVRDLAQLGREVHVVLTVRDLARQLPSLWQETIKAARGWTLAEFVEELRSGEGAAGADLRRMLDYPGLVETWSSQLPREHVHLVTVPPPGASRSLLWERFCSVVDLAPAAFSLDVPSSNDSLGAEQVELLRRVNRVLAGRMTWPAPYLATVKRGLAQQVLAPRAGARLAVPAGDLDWLQETTSGLVERLRDSGADVVGDLTDLAPSGDPAAPAAGPSEEQLTEEQLTEEAVAAIAEVLLQQAETRRQQQATLARLQEQRAARAQHNRRAGLVRRVLRPRGGA